MLDIVTANSRSSFPDAKNSQWRPPGIEAASIAADSVLSQTVATCHAQVYGRQPSIAISPGFNDTHDLVREMGIPALMYGPGTTGTTHTPDEYSVIDDLYKATQVLTQTVLTLLA